MSSTEEEKLNTFRALIDQIDSQILALMNDRIKTAQSIAELKNQSETPVFYRPERESQVLRRLKATNQGMMQDGTYTEAAAIQHFGSKINREYLPTIDEIFKAAETGQTNFAVVPIENSTEGGVSAAMDRLTNTTLIICGEIYLKIHHNLISLSESLDQVQRVVSHPQALGQCRNWLRRHLPNAELVPCNSNAEGVRQAAEDPAVAAIAAKEAAENYKLDVLVANIEDEPGNTTRFLVLSDRKTPPSGEDKTSLLLSARNKPGALFHLLKPLVDHDLDMTRLESRPSRSGHWEYVFFVDIKGHQDDPGVIQALNEIKLEAGLFRCLGSYPASS